MILLCAQGRTHVLRYRIMQTSSSLILRSAMYLLCACPALSTRRILTDRFSTNPLHMPRAGHIPDLQFVRSTSKVLSQDNFDLCQERWYQAKSAASFANRLVLLEPPVDPPHDFLRIAAPSISLVSQEPGLRVSPDLVGIYLVGRASHLQPCQRSTRWCGYGVLVTRRPASPAQPAQLPDSAQDV